MSANCDKCGGQLHGPTCRLCDMFAARKAPGAVSDREFFAGRGTLEDQYGGEPWYLKKITDTAKRHGYKPSPNDIYEPQLANFPGDPSAFIPATGGRGHVKKVCERKSTTCHGLVKHTRRGPEKDPLAPEHRKSLGENVIRRLARKKLKSNPELRRLSKRELRERIIHEHAVKF